VGFIDSLKKALGKQVKGKEVGEELAGLGVKVLLDKKLSDRLLAVQELFDDLEAEITAANPLAYIAELNRRLDMLNRAIHSLASPYYRSGSNANFRQMMEGWTLWHALAKTWISSVEDRIQTVYVTNGQKQALSKIASIDIETLVRRLHSVLVMHVFQDGMLVLAESYLSEDVAPSTATVVQTAGQHGGFDIGELKREDVT